MEFTMGREAVKVQLFRFVDALPPCTPPSPSPATSANTPSGRAGDRLLPGPRQLDAAPDHRYALRHEPRGGVTGQVGRRVAGDRVPEPGVRLADRGGRSRRGAG